MSSVFPFAPRLLPWLAVAAMSSAGASPIDIPTLQRLGMEGNGLVRAAQAELRMAEAGVTSASALPNPQLALLRGQDQARIADAVGGGTRSLFISQPIENPVLRGARIASAEAGITASRAGLERTRADVAAEIRVRAYELLLRQEQARAAADELKLLEGMRDRIKVRVEVGESARYELIKADSEVLAARSRQEAAQLQAQRVRVALLLLTGAGLAPDFELRASLLDPVRQSGLDALRQQALDANPDLARLQAELERAQQRTRQERAAVLPSLEVVLGQQQNAELRSNVLGLNMRLPLFDRRHGPIAERVAEGERLRETLAFRRFEIGQQMESAWQAKQIALRKMEMFEGGIVREAESVLRVAEAAYRFGERGLLDVLDAQRVLRGSRAELLQARFELHAAAAEIDRIRSQHPDRNEQK